MVESKWLCGQDPPPPLRLTLWDHLTGQATAKTISHYGRMQAWKLREDLATMALLRTPLPRRRRRFGRRRNG